MADKPEMTLERIAERIDEVGNRIFMQNVFRARELRECANELRALSPPRITRIRILEAVARGWCARQAASTIMDPVLAATITDEVIRELGITVDPPTEADK